MNLTFVQLFILRSSLQSRLSPLRSGLDFSLSTRQHNLFVSNSRFSYFTSEFIKSPLNSVNLNIFNAKFDHFLSSSLAISSNTEVVSNEIFHSRLTFSEKATKVRLKNCEWSNFFSFSDEGGCFGLKTVSEVKINGCRFLNIVTYAVNSTGKGAFMVVINSSDKSNEFEFENNIMSNITNIANNSTYHAFYASCSGSSRYEQNTMALLSKGGKYSCLLQSLTLTEISYSNFTNCDCTIGSGISVEFFDKSSTTIRYSLYSKLGGSELLRLSCAEKAISQSVSESQNAKVFIEYVSFVENDGSLLIVINNNIADPNDDNFNSNFGIRFSCTYSQFYGNKDMNCPFYVKVPKLNVFAIDDFVNCVSDSQLVVQSEINDFFYQTLFEGWKVIPRPTEIPSDLTQSPKPTVTETQNQTPEETQKQNISVTANPTFSSKPRPTSENHFDIVKEGDVFTTTPTTSSLLIEGSVASINIENLQSIEFSSYNGSSQSSEINLFGKGIEQAKNNQKDVELTVKDFNNLTINVLNSQRENEFDSVVSLPIVVSEVSNFEINKDNLQEQNEISIKTINAPTKTKDFISHIASNSQLNVKYISFSTGNSKTRIHQTVTSHSKYASNADSVVIKKNVDAELINFTIKAKININQNSKLILRQTKVDYQTVVEFNLDSLDETSQILIENPKTLNSLYDSYQFAPNKIKLKINDNSHLDRKSSIIKGIAEDNCKQMFVSFQPQTNIRGIPYRSHCEDEQLFVSIESVQKETHKSSKINNGIITVIIFGCIIAIALIVVVIYFRIKKPRQAIIDNSDDFKIEVEVDNTHNCFYN